MSQSDDTVQLCKGIAKLVTAQLPLAPEAVRAAFAPLRLELAFPHRAVLGAAEADR